MGEGLRAAGDFFKNVFAGDGLFIDTSSSFFVGDFETALALVLETVLVFLIGSDSAADDGIPKPSPNDSFIGKLGLGAATSAVKLGVVPCIFSVVVFAV